MAQDPAANLTAQPKTGWRLGLFLPYILLLLLALAWTGGWFWIRGKAAAEMSAWIAREAQKGRQWTCADRSIAGFPFRIELRCASVSFARADGTFSLGPATAVVQVYNPRHAILELIGPFRVQQGDLSADVTWTSLAASFQGKSDGFTLASLVVAEPKGSVAGAAPDPIDFSTKRVELHARPTPGRFESEGAVDVSLRAAQASIPTLDALAGSATPTDIDVDTTIERATVLRTGKVVNELEKWRQAGGRLDITQLSLVKGAQRVRAKGVLAFDDAHRPMGQLELRAAGLDSLIGQVMGQRFGAEKGALIGNLVGQLLGGLQAKTAGPTGEEPSEAGLKPLPPLKIASGRLMLGPIPVPNVLVPPLY